MPGRRYSVQEATIEKFAKDVTIEGGYTIDKTKFAERIKFDPEEAVEWISAALMHWECKKAQEPEAERNIHNEDYQYARVFQHSLIERAVEHAHDANPRLALNCLDMTYFFSTHLGDEQLARTIDRTMTASTVAYKAHLTPTASEQKGRDLGDQHAANLWQAHIDSATGDDDAFRQASIGFAAEGMRDAAALCEPRTAQYYLNVALGFASYHGLYDLEDSISTRLNFLNESASEISSSNPDRVLTKVPGRLGTEYKM